MKTEGKFGSYRILIIILLMLIPAKGFSQDIRMGIHCDPLITWMNTNSNIYTSEGVRPGIDFGVNVYRYFAPNYAFSTGISLINAGGRTSSDSTISMVFDNFETEVTPGKEVIYKLRYLSIPVGIRLSTNQIGYVSFFSDFGLDPKILISSKIDIPSKSIEDENGSNEVNKINLGWHFNAGVEYSLGGSTALVAGIGIDNNFFDVTKDVSKANQDKDRSQSNIFRIRLGVIF